MRTKSRDMNYAIAYSSSEGEIPSFIVFKTKKERDQEFKKLLKLGYYECPYSLEVKPILLMNKCHFNSTIYYLLDKKVN